MGTASSADDLPSLTSSTCADVAKTTTTTTSSSSSKQIVTTARNATHDEKKSLLMANKARRICLTNTSNQPTSIKEEKDEDEKKELDDTNNVFTNQECTSAILQRKHTDKLIQHLKKQEHVRQSRNVPVASSTSASSSHDEQQQEQQRTPSGLSITVSSDKSNSTSSAAVVGLKPKQNLTAVIIIGKESTKSETVLFKRNNNSNSGGSSNNMTMSRYDEEKRDHVSDVEQLQSTTVVYENIHNHHEQAKKTSTDSSTAPIASSSSSSAPTASTSSSTSTTTEKTKKTSLVTRLKEAVDIAIKECGLAVVSGNYKYAIHKFIIETKRPFTDVEVKAIETVLLTYECLYPTCLVPVSNTNAAQTITIVGPPSDIMKCCADAIHIPRNDTGYGCPEYGHACLENMFARLGGPRMRNELQALVSMHGELKLGCSWAVGSGVYTKNAQNDTQQQVHCFVHTHSPDIRKNETDPAWISRCTITSLDALQAFIMQHEILQTKEVVTFAMPLISCRMQGWDPENVQTLMTNAITEWFQQHPSSKIAVHLFVNKKQK